jgi:hypothetical protein
MNADTETKGLNSFPSAPVTTKRIHTMALSTRQRLLPLSERFKTQADSAPRIDPNPTIQAPIPAHIGRAAKRRAEAAPRKRSKSRQAAAKTGRAVVRVKSVPAAVAAADAPESGSVGA